MRSEKWFAHTLLKIFGVQVQVQVLDPSSRSERGRGKLYFSNHVSWLDIFAFNAVNPIVFIAKSEIAQWPLIGKFAVKSGTLFIERGKRQAVRDVVHSAAETLKAGQDVAVFPEGTTGPGDAPLPFHSNFVQPAILAGAPIVPVSLQYLDRQGNWTSLPAFLGEQTLLENIRVLMANLGGFTVRLVYHPTIEPGNQTRQELCAKARQMIASGCATHLDTVNQ
ncbi:MAG: lysophospholipid acyltransferase family protein [Limnobacter sp.]|nr:lysophospholipid acyltransferase family protein [Limnobacter sp.]